jgi:hypothetical protein
MAGSCTDRPINPRFWPICSAETLRHAGQSEGVIDLRIPVVLFPVALALSGCQRPEMDAQRGMCGAGDLRPWSPVEAAATPASDLRALADADPNFPGAAPMNHETWFALPSGEIMLCQSNALPQDSCVGQWWQFQRSGEGHRITAQSAWVCLT